MALSSDVSFCDTIILDTSHVRDVFFIILLAIVARVAFDDGFSVLSVNLINLTAHQIQQCEYMANSK